MRRAKSEKIILIPLLILGITLKGFSQNNYSDYFYKKTGIKFYEDFEDNRRGWATWTNANYTIDIEKDYYIISSNSDKYLPTQSFNEKAQYFTIEPNTDFQIEAEIKYVSGQDNNANVLGFGRATEKSSTGFYSQYRYCFSNDGSIRIDNYNAATRTFEKLLDWTKSKELKPNGSYNKLTIRKVKNTMYFFLNEVLVYSCNSLPFYGDDLGIQPNYSSTVHVNKLIVGEITNKTSEQIKDFASSKPPIDEKATNYQAYKPIKSIFQESFSDNEYGWYTGVDQEERIYSVNNGYYTIQSFNHLTAAATFNSKGDFFIDESKNFQIEAKIKFVDGERNNMNSINWGGKEIGYTAFRFGFTGNGSFKVTKYDNEKRTFTSYKKWTKSDKIKTDGYNKLTIRKVGDNYYYFINEQLVFTDSYKPFSGQKISIMSNSNTRIHADDIFVSYIDENVSSNEVSQFKNGNNKSKPIIASPSSLYREHTLQDTLFSENFNNNDRNWKEGNFDGGFYYRVIDGQYQMTYYGVNGYKNNDVFNTNNEYTLDKKRDFQIEVDIKQAAGKTDNTSDIVWGFKSKEIEYNFGISGSSYRINHYSPSLKNYEPIVDYTKSDVIKEREFNRLTIRKVSSKYYFFINGVEVYNCDFIPYESDLFVLRSNANSVTYFDNINIGYLDKESGISAKVETVANTKTEKISDKEKDKNEPSSESTSPKLNKPEYTYVAFTEDLPAYKKAKKAYDEKNHALAASEVGKLIKYYPEEPLLYKLASLVNMQLSKYDEAYQQIELAYILNPIDFEVVAQKSIFAALLGKQNEALKYAGYLGLMVDKKWFDYLSNYMRGWQKSWSAANPSGANGIGQAILAFQNSFTQNESKFYDYVFKNIFIDCKDKYIARSKENLENRFAAAVVTIYDLKLPWEMAHRVMYFLYEGAIEQLNNEEISKDKKIVLYNFAYTYIESRLWGEQEQGKVSNPFFYCRFTDSKYSYLLESGDLDKALALNSIRIEMAQSGPLMRFELFNLLADKLFLLGYTNRRNEGTPYAETLATVNQFYSSPLHVTKAFGALSNYYRETNPPKGVEYAQKEIDYMISTGYTKSISLAYNSLATAYLLNKEPEKAINNFIKSAENTDSEGGKGINYYNIGIRLWQSGAKKEAIEMYLKAEKAMTNHLLKLDEFSRNRFYSNLYNNNVLLALNYQRMGQNRESFETIERAKSLDLALSIDKNQKPLNLSGVQSMLRPNQLMLYYSRISFSKEDGNFLIYAISHDDIKVEVLSEVDNPKAYNSLKLIRSNYKNALSEVEKEVASAELRKPSFNINSNEMLLGDFNLMTEKFRQSLKADMYFISDDMGKGYYKAFLEPISNFLEGKKELIIVPDAALFYIPFEAIKDNNGQFLVENYDISYIQSPTVLESLNKRKYNDRGKSILAMGGANFNPPSLQANVIKSFNDVQRIRLKVFEDIGNGKKSLRQSWVDLGHTTMNYLPGTVTEINSIKETIPSAEIYLGDDMSESRLKELSKNGSLKDFKALHFATHGWVESFVPELSGYTMTLYPDERNGEDGIIYLHEVEKLDIKADMVMLSACQTALGKEQAGKGVSGLNKAFIAAGANSTITSLWTVNDYATSILASEIYRMVFNEGKSYFNAINEVKRNFINGVYDNNGIKMNKISFWAPFIYYGSVE